MNKILNNSLTIGHTPLVRLNRVEQQTHSTKMESHDPSFTALSKAKSICLMFGMPKSAMHV